MHRTTIMLPEDLRLRAIHLARELGISLGELVRTSLETKIAGTIGKEVRDPMFADDAVYDGPGPTDGSVRHDHYIYGDM